MTINTKANEDSICLPQNDRDPTRRLESIQGMQKLYRWAHDLIGDAGMLQPPLPRREFPSPEWRKKVGDLRMSVAENMQKYFKALGSHLETALQEARDRGDLEAVREIQNLAQYLLKVPPKLADNPEKAITFLVTSIAEHSKALWLIDDAVDGEDAFQKYRNQYVTLPLNNAIAEGNQFHTDDIFGWLRIAGPNPMRISKLQTNVKEFFPMWKDKDVNAILKGIADFENDCIEDAENEGRFYTLEYPELIGCETGNFSGDPEHPKTGYYAYSPRALLAIPRRTCTRKWLLPIAIQCGGQTNDAIFTANEKQTPPLTWLAAKTTVQVADALVHETIYHLGRCHLLLEVIVCATHRTMAKSHPIAKLLEPHLEGTASINGQAAHNLINAGGTIDYITAPPIEKSQQLAAGSITASSFRFNDWMLPKELECRGVSKEKSPLLHYPYRDDALRVWGAINDWVSEYVRVFYRSQTHISEDAELAAWCLEITSQSQGKLHGFGDQGEGKITSIEYLIEALTMIVFTASAQHAAVNFPQGKVMSFTPAMPLSGRSPAPTNDTSYESEQELVKKMFPNRIASLLQLNALNIIGVCQYTTLGVYEEGHFKGAPDEVRAALEKFKSDLTEISLIIQKRNKEEEEAQLPTYSYLDPKNIPQSINI